MTTSQSDISGRYFLKIAVTNTARYPSLLTRLNQSEVKVHSRSVLFSSSISHIVVHEGQVM